MSNPIETDQGKICDNCGKPFTSYNIPSGNKVKSMSANEVIQREKKSKSKSKHVKTSMWSKVSASASKPLAKNSGATQLDKSGFCKCERLAEQSNKSGERPITGVPHVEEDGQTDRVSTALPDVFGDDHEEARDADARYESEGEDIYVKHRERPVGSSLGLEIPLHHPPADPEKMNMIKVPKKLIRFESKPFDPETYVEEDWFDTDESGARIRGPDIVRWRNVTKPDGSVSRESNARIVKWSDDSLQLMIGDKHFGISKEDLKHYQEHLFRKHKQGIYQSQGRITSLMRLMPSSGIDPERGRVDTDRVEHADGAENSILNKFSTIHLYLPARQVIWRGRFSTKCGSEHATISEEYKLQVPYYMAHSNAIAYSRKLGNVLQATLLPLLSLQDDPFPNGYPPPEFCAPYIYFLPSSSSESVAQLIDFMNKTDHFMKCYCDRSHELLVLTSAQLRKGLPDQSSCRETEDFLWGIFCPPKG